MFPAAPKYIQLYPTSRCNQQCRFCFNAPSERACDMTYAAALRLLEILSDKGISDLDIMGGEPFLLDWMPDLLESAAKRGITVNISTNGSRPGVMRRLAGMDPSVLNVGVSIEGSTADAHNALTGCRHFDSALQCIRTLVSLGLDPVVKTVVNRTTIADVENIVAIIGELGVRRYYLIQMDVMTDDTSLVRDSLGYVDFVEFWLRIKEGSRHIQVFRVNASCFERDKLPSGARCAGGVLKLSVMPDGSVYPCNLFQWHREFRLGSIFEEDLDVIWKDDRLSFFRTFHENRCWLENCNNRVACTGGCPAHGHLHYGDPDVPDIRCSREALRGRRP